MTLDKRIYGNGSTPNIVNISAKYGKINVFTEDATGVKQSIHNYQPWVLAERPIDQDFMELAGKNAYKYIRFFNSEKHWKEFRREHKHEIWSPRSLTESYLLTSGETYGKETKRKDVSILCFDIETTGLHHNDAAKVLLIANTYRKGDKVINKLFSLDDYANQREFFDAWSKWVRELNPSILATYNGFAFDIPYMLYCSTKAGASLRIGRDGSEMNLEIFESKFRQDQSRQIAYRMPKVWGRELVDLFFVVQKWDIGKKFSRYSLKTVIKEAGLEREDRAMVDASQIWKYWDRRHSEPDVWQQVKDYAEHDSDDTLNIWDMVGDSYFYACQAYPFTLERMCLSASGSQINSLFMRYYLSKGSSIPKPDEKKKFQGAVSMGFPGVYNYGQKVDLNAMYPSIILQWKVYDRKKDPDGLMLALVQAFREQRLEYKQKAKTDKFYEALDSVAKASLNSFYGAMSTKGLHFNSQECAEFITGQGREILLSSIYYLTGLTEEDLKNGRKRKE